MVDAIRVTLLEVLATLLANASVESFCAVIILTKMKQRSAVALPVVAVLKLANHFITLECSLGYKVVSDILSKANVDSLFQARRRAALTSSPVSSAVI